MSNVIEADPSIVDLLKEGDGRTTPSSIIEAKHEGSPLVSGSLDEPDKEEAVKLEVEANLRKVIDYGNEAIKDLADLAASQEHPRPYEAMSSLLKSVVDANVALLDVRKKTTSQLLTKDKRTNEDTPTQSKDDIMKASVGDLLTMIDRRRRQTENDDVIDIDPND